MAWKASIMAGLLGIALWRQYHTVTTTIIVIPRGEVVTAVEGYRYVGPPSISRDFYIALFCNAGSEACGEAGGMYDLLVDSGFDPAIHAAQAEHETSLGTAGIGRPQYKNLHGVQCHAGDGRIDDAKVGWGNGCAGVYATYTDAVRTWIKVISKEYVAEGLDTPAKAVWKYAPTSDGNDPPAYIADMEKHIDQWRKGGGSTRADTPSAVRQQLVAQALALRGIPYIYGGRSASGGDCSGTMQYIFKTVAKVDIGTTTYSQLDNPALLPTAERDIRAGDLWYGQYSDDQHTGMIADVDGDGKWDLINNGGLQSNMHVDYDFLSTAYFNEHTIGYRSVPGD